MLMTWICYKVINRDEVGRECFHLQTFPVCFFFFTRERTGEWTQHIIKHAASMYWLMQDKVVNPPPPKKYLLKLIVYYTCKLDFDVNFVKVTFHYMFIGIHFKILMVNLLHFAPKVCKKRLVDHLIKLKGTW